MADSELIVRLRGENSDLKAKLAEVTNASKSSADGMGASFKSALSSIASAIGITFSVATVVNFAKQSIQAFSDSEAAAASLANTVANMGGSAGMASGLQNMLDNMKQMSGFGDEDLSAAFRDLYVQTGNTGEATRALNVAMNMAAIYHTSVAEAAGKVWLVMNGMTRTMRDYGMVTRDGATAEDYLAELGQKMAGGLSTNLDTVDGKVRKLKTSWDTLKESVGGAIAPAILPGMEKLSNFFNGVALAKEWDDYLNTLDANGRRRMIGMGATMGDAWIQNFLDAIKGGTDGSDVWSDVGTGQHHTPLPASSITPPVTTVTNVFRAAWDSISMVGGNLPELTKYIGNLRQASKLNLDVNINIKGGGSIPAGTSPKKAADTIAQAAAPKIAAVITHGQGLNLGGGMGNKVAE